MSEPMAIETIAAEYFKLKGYLVETRVPFRSGKNGKGGSSDIDVLGFNPSTRQTIWIECKAYGSPYAYPDYGASSRRIKEMKKLFKNASKNWKKFIEKGKTNKWNFKKLNEVCLIIPGFCEEKGKIEKEISKKYHFKACILPIHELIRDLFFEICRDKGKRRKRYANSALEFCRWFLRCRVQLDLSQLDQNLKEEEKKQKTLFAAT